MRSFKLFRSLKLGIDVFHVRWFSGEGLITYLKPENVLDNFLPDLRNESIEDLPSIVSKIILVGFFA